MFIENLLLEFIRVGLVLVSVRKVLCQDCTSPDVTSGNFVGQITEGGNAAVLCDAGYEGGGKATCAHGSWTVLPPCIAKDCGPRDVSHGSLTGDTTYDGSATVICDNGYEGGGAAECGTNGDWDIVPDCTPVKCGKANITNGENVGDAFYNGSPFVQCEDGYLGGGNGLTCQATGVWKIDTSCNPITCPDPGVAEGQLVGDDFYSGSAEIVCNAGYEGGGSLTCQTDGTWDAVPLCAPKDCGTPTIPHGSLAVGSSTFYDGLATVNCDAGYIGGGAATCQEDATWALPICSPRDCGDPGEGNSQLTGGTLFMDGNDVFISCNSGYDGGGVATCLSTGLWKTPLPSCAPKDCGTPTTPHGSLAVRSSTLYDGLAIVVCDSGYTGGGIAICQENATWTLQTCSLRGNNEGANMYCVIVIVIASVIFLIGVAGFLLGFAFYRRQKKSSESKAQSHVSFHAHSETADTDLTNYERIRSQLADTPNSEYDHLTVIDETNEGQNYHYENCGKETANADGKEDHAFNDGGQHRSAHKTVDYENTGVSST